MSTRQRKRGGAKVFFRRLLCGRVSVDLVNCKNKNKIKIKCVVLPKRTLVDRFGVSGTNGVGVQVRPVLIWAFERSFVHPNLWFNV